MEGLQAIALLWQDRQRPAALSVAAAIIMQTAESDLRAAGAILSALSEHFTVLLQSGATVARSPANRRAAGTAKSAVRDSGALDVMVAGEKLEAGMQLLLQLGESNCAALLQLLPSLLAQVTPFVTTKSPLDSGPCTPGIQQTSNPSHDAHWFLYQSFLPFEINSKEKLEGR